MPRPSAPATAHGPVVHTFPATAVRLLDGPFKAAQDTDVRYVLALDADRLCAPYLREAGLPSPAPSYGSWEADGLDGHIGGHYLSACAQLWAATGDDRLRARMEHVLDVFERCQRAVGTGFLGGVPGGSALGEELAGGHVDADVFGLNGRWVPLYNLHKTLAGLLDAATLGGSARALTMATSFADWWLTCTRGLDQDAREDMLRTEFGGMNDAFAELGGLTGREDLLAESRRLAHRALLVPLAEGRDALDGLHANTQIAKVVGYARLATLTGETAYRAAAQVFWQTVTEHRTVAFGGNSVREHFHPVDDPTTLIAERQGPETCNTYNMLKLTELLFRDTGAADLLDFYERAMVNHVLSSQHPGHGGFVYFTPLRPAHYRVYSQPHTSMWCCVGSGLENHARYGRLVFGRSDDDLLVNLYVAAELDWADRGLRVRIQADHLTSDTAVLHVDASAPVDLTVRMRRPRWATEMHVDVDGEPVPAEERAGYLVLRRRWQASQTVTVRFTTGLTAELLPGGAPWVAYRWGPVVLAARNGSDDLDGLLASEDRMAHVAAGPTRALASTPVVSTTDPLDAAVLRSRSPLVVELAVTLPRGAATVLLEPFTAIHDERCTLYWPVGADAAARHAELVEADRADAAAALTVDEVVAGEQQPESDHAFVGERTRAGGADGTHWRSATGWFAYTLTDPAGVGRLLRVRFREQDADDPRDHELRLDGATLGSPVSSRVAHGVIEEDYLLPRAVRDDAPGTGRVFSVHARGGRATGDLLGVRLTRAAP